MAWQPKSLNSLAHPKYRDQFPPSLFRTNLPSSNHLLSCALIRHPQHAKLSLIHPLRKSFLYFFPPGPSTMFGSTLSLTMRASEHAYTESPGHRQVPMNAPDRPRSHSRFFLPERYSLLRIKYTRLLQYLSNQASILGSPSIEIEYQTEVSEGIHFGVELEM